MELKRQVPAIAPVNGEGRIIHIKILRSKHIRFNNFAYQCAGGARRRRLAPNSCGEVAMPIIHLEI